MKKHLITILTLSSALYISNANASGYMKASINSISPSEAKYTLSGVDNFTNYKIGYGGSVELGQYLAEKLHTSIEASYGEAEIEEPSFNNYKAKILALMLNANYDFVTEDNITIYGQIGAGSASALDNNKAKTFKPAWQTGAGARYQYNSSTDLVLGYKYFAIPDGFKIANSGIEFENYTAHNVELGLQFNF